MERVSLRRVVLWMLPCGAAVLAVVFLSLKPRDSSLATPAVSAGQESGVPAGPIPQSGEAEPGAASTAGAPRVGANAWAALRAPAHLAVRAQDVVELRGAMTLEEGTDNEGMGSSSGGPPKVGYVWCEDDGCEEGATEPATGSVTAQEHAAVFELTVPQDRTYYPWARVWWEDSCGNSIIVAVEAEGRPVQEFVIQDGTLRWWHWLPLAGEQGLALRQGRCRVLVKNREDGARLSCILFCARTYAAYKPEGPEG